MPRPSRSKPQKVESAVFSKEELEVFKQVFTRLADQDGRLKLQKYVDFMEDFNKNDKGSIISIMFKELRAEGNIELDVEGFLEILEEKVGSIDSTQGLKRSFSFIVNDLEREEATIQDLQRIKKEIGLTISDKDLQKLVNFVSESFNTKSGFSLEEFEHYVRKTHLKN